MPPRAFHELTVYLNGGLNTADDPSTVRPNELTEATGMEYRPPSDGLFPTLGRSRADVTAAGTAINGDEVFGLVYVQIDGTPASDYLVAFSNGSAYMSSGEGDGTFKPQTVQYAVSLSRWSAASTSFADGTHYGNDWYFWNGSDRNYHILGSNISGSSGRVMLQHGAVSVSASGTAVASGSGSDLGAGAYEVWWTELDFLNGKESAYTASIAASVTVTAGENIVFTLPGTAQGVPFNTGMISGYLYATQAGGKFPHGFDHSEGVGTTIVAGASYTITAVPTTRAYPIVGPLGGVAVSANGRPPATYAMRVFEDSLVAIDADDRQLVKYSLADDAHHFPSINYILFETDRQDKLNALEVINNSLLVFSDFYAYRVDYLPRHTDREPLGASRGRAKTKISNGHGCVGPRAVAPFTVFGDTELCLFVARDGIYITDGYRVDYASGNLDWASTVDMSNLYRSTMKNNPKRSRVEWYYVDNDGTSYKRLDFYYHKKLLRKDVGPFPGLTIMGPTDVPGLAAALGTLSSDWQMWTGSLSDTKCYYEGTGTTDAANLVDASSTINKRWKTKDFYFAGADGEFEVPHVFLHQSQTTASGSATAVATFRYDEGASNRSYTATATLDFSKKDMQPLRLCGENVSPHNRGQAMNLRVTKDDGGTYQELDYVVFVVDRRGKMQSAVSS